MFNAVETINELYWTILINNIYLLVLHIYFPKFPFIHQSILRLVDFSIHIHNVWMKINNIFMRQNHYLSIVTTILCETYHQYIIMIAILLFFNKQMAIENKGTWVLTKDNWLFWMFICCCIHPGIHVTKEITVNSHEKVKMWESNIWNTLDVKEITKL
jgi:hypothetical protein